MGGDVLVERGDVDAVGVVDGALDVAGGHDLGALLGHQARAPRAHVAVALDGHAHVRELLSVVLEDLAQREHAPAPSRGVTPERAVQPDGLAGDDAGAEPVVARVVVEDPRHDLGVGVHVRGGDVGRRPDEVADGVDELAREALELAVRELARVDLDAALAAAERDADQRGLPGHEAGERADVVDVDVGVVAQAALVGAKRVVVLDAVADVVAQRPVVLGDEQLDAQLARRRHQRDARRLSQLEDVEGL